VVEDFSNFASILQEAVTQTAFTGDKVGLVLSHTRLTQQLVETPPVKGWNLRWYLERRARHLKTFTTDAVWSYQPALPTKNAKAVLLNLFPKPFLDQLVHACEEAGLQLVKVFPATAILTRQLKDLPVGDQETAVLAAETGGTTTVIIGRKDGQIYLGRTLNSSWNIYPDRVNVDLNRTLLYVKQQFGAPVDSLWLFGSGTADHTGPMQLVVKSPVKTSPVPSNPYYWIQETLKLPFGESNNLISSELHEAPRRRLLVRATAVIISLMAVAAVATAAVFQVLVTDRQKTFDRLQPKVEKLQDRKAQLQQRELELAQHKQFVNLVIDQSIPAVPGWFLGYLGNAVPDELYLSRLQFKRDDDLWVFQVSGNLQPSTNTAPGALAEAVSRFTNNLASGPFHVKITRNSNEKENSSAGPKSPGLGAIQTARAGTPPRLEDQFVLEGVMR